MIGRDRIEAGFEGWGLAVVRWRWPVIAAVLAFSGVLIAQIPRMEIEVSTESFLHADDPILLAYNEFRDQFERDDRLLIAIHTDRVFDRDFLERLRDFHRDLEDEVPQVDEVDSLINARSTRGDQDQLIVEDLFEEWPEDDAALAAIKSVALANPLLPHLVISEDLTYTVVSVAFDTYSALDQGLDELAGFDDPLDAEPAGNGNARRYLTGDENNANMVVVREVMARYEAPDFRFHISGSPVFTERIGLGMQGDMRFFLLLACVVSGLFLFVLFRRPSGTLLPLVVVVISVLTTIGCIPLLGYQLQVPTQILPAFLLAVGIGDSVHILAIFYQQLRSGIPKREAIGRALGHSGLAVFMTTLTTSAALLSFSVAAMAPVANLGILAPIGVGFAFVYTMTLLPALLAVIPIKESGPEVRAPLAFLDGFLIEVGSISHRHPWPVIAFWSLFIAFGALGAAQLRFSYNPMNWFREGDPIRVDTELINQELRGAMTLDVIFATNRENGLHEPALLNAFDRIKDINPEIEKNQIFIGKTISLVDILKEINKALNENGDSHYAIPQDRLLVAQELLLFENSGSDDLEKLVDSQFSTGRMTLKVPWIDAIAYPEFLDLLETRYREVVGEDVDFHITGRTALLSRTFSAMIKSMSRSYVIAFILITPLMIMLLSSFKWWLVSMIPNLAPILITLGVMGWFDFSLDGFTLLIGSIALGLAVDDTIHFLHNFQRYNDRGGDPAQAIRDTLATTGQALLFTSLVLCAGFFLFMLGSMQSTFAFGFLTGFALIVAFAADVTLVPAMIPFLTRRTT